MLRLKRTGHAMGEGHLGSLLPPGIPDWLFDHTLLFGSDTGFHYEATLA